MRVHMRFFVLLILFLWSHHGSAAAETFKVGLFQLEPLNFLNSRGKEAGFNTDLIKEAFKDSDYQPVFIPGSWNECYQRLLNREIDLMTTVAFSPERSELMEFSKEPVVLIWGQVFCRPDSTVNNILDLRSKTVAIMKMDINGQNFINTLGSFGAKCEIVEFSTHHEVFEAVAQKKAIAGVAPHHFGLRHCHSYGLVSTSIQFSPFSVFFATKKGTNLKLLSILDQKLIQWKADPDSFYSQKLDFWLGSSTTVRRIIPKWMFFLFFTLLLITFVTLYGNRFLNRLVKQKTMELANQEQEFRNLVECANSIILRLDYEKKISFINQYGQKLLKFTPEMVIGKSIYETILPETQITDGQNLKAIVEPVFSDPSAHTVVENENLCGDGSRVFIRWSNRAFFDEEGNFKEMLCIGNDISQQKKLEQEILQVQKMEAVGRLAGGIAHDFNNILSVIIGNLDLAKNRVHNAEVLTNHLQSIEKACERAKNLVRQILAFSRKNDSQKSTICLSDEIRDSLRMLKPTLPSTIKILEKYSTSRKIFADPGQLNQIMMNLCTNSMHALNGEPGSLHIEVSECSAPKDSQLTSSKNYLKISVSDTGQGIPEEHLSRIFEPFFTTKEKFKGSGMGLSVVHGIVKEHGGEINVFSEQGKGTTFEIFFPTTECLQGPQELKHHINEELKGKERIIVVDDEPMILMVNSEMLKISGYQVFPFASPLDALNAFKSAPGNFDLLVTDMTMPDMTGDILAKNILEIKPKFPILILTGHSNKIDRQRAMDLGISGFAYKPLSSKELLREIRRIVDNIKIDS
ncbi:MAG: ATP-binding protein [Candidatus Rifleibacteriota bacterium]